MTYARTLYRRRRGHAEILVQRAESGKCEIRVKWSRSRGADNQEWKWYGLVPYVGDGASIYHSSTNHGFGHRCVPSEPFGVR